MVYNIEKASLGLLYELATYWYNRIAVCSKTAVQQIVEIEIELAKRRCGK